MNEKQKAAERLSEVKSPYATLDKWKGRDDIVKMLKTNPDVAEYDLGCMQPVVTYDDWVICRYKDGRFYCFDEDGVAEVTPTQVLEYNQRFEAILPNGTIAKGELACLYPCNFSGEADDCSCFVYFD